MRLKESLKVSVLLCVIQFILITQYSFADSGKHRSGQTISTPSPSRGPASESPPTTTTRGSQSAQQVYDNCIANTVDATEADCLKQANQVRVEQEIDHGPQEDAEEDKDLRQYVESCQKNNANKLVTDCVAEYKQGKSVDDVNSSGGCAAGLVRDSISGQCVSKDEACSDCKKFGTCERYSCGSSQASNDNSPVNQCEQAQDDIMSECDPDTKEWMQNLSNITGTLEQVSSSVNASACSTLTATNAASQAALATFSYTCNNSYTNCKRVCLGVPNTNCESFGKKGKDAQAKAVQAMQKVMISIKQCQAAFGGEGDPCARPENAGSISCKGMPPIPAANRLPVAGSGLENTDPVGLSHNGSGGASDGAGSKGYGLDDPGAPEDNYAAKPVKQGEEIGGAKGGSGASGGGDGGAGGPVAGGQGEEKQGLISKVLSGFFGGGGGGGSGSSGKGGGWRNLFGLGEGEKKQANKTPDLRQFMPGGRLDPNRHRGVAGQFVGKDGISGPHADLWQLINNRYQYKRPTLLP